MRRLFTVGLLAGIVLMSPSSEGATSGQSSSAAPNGGLFAPTKDSQPFENLFPNPLHPKAEDARKPWFKAQADALQNTPVPRVVCGMTIIPVDPAFDRRVRAPAPDISTSSGAVPAPACEREVSTGSTFRR